MPKNLVVLATLLTIFMAARATDVRSAETALEPRLVEEGVSALAKAVESDGDAARGAKLFHGRSMACTRCHAIDDGKSPLGPNLALPKPGTKLTTEHVVESILFPSKVVGEEFRAVQVVTDEGRILVGLVREETKGAVHLVLPLKSGEVLEIPRKEIDEIVPSKVSLMPVGQVNLLADRGQFLDLAKYVLEVGRRGPAFAKSIQPDPADLRPVADAPIDHAAVISRLGELDLGKGKDLYTHYCVNCHGRDGNKTLNPLARRFAKDSLKFGTDPYAMWKTVSYGNGLMFPQSGLLSPEERYLVVNYIRETFVKDENPSQYFEPGEEYLAKVNDRAEVDATEYGTEEIEIAAGMIDGREGRNMDYGPALAHSIAFDKDDDEIVERALAVRLPGENVVCYDTARGSIAGLWNGKLADTNKTHHTSYKGKTCMSPGGAVRYRDVDDRGWASGSLPSRNAEHDPDTDEYAFAGYFLFGGQVLLRHVVGDRTIDELPSALPADAPTYSRTFRTGAGTDETLVLVGRIEDGKSSNHGGVAWIEGKGGQLAARVTGDTKDVVFQGDDHGGLWLRIPADSEVRILTVWFAVGEDGAATSLEVPEDPARPDFDALLAGGPRRWSRTVRTQGILGEPIEGYAADELPIRRANPYGSWMRTTALDFLSDGTMAVCTLSGDVWLVRWNDEGLSDITWSRYATGLYEPLGLKVVDDLVYVRGRDRITRLHDLNADGEADHYETFHQEGVIGSGYHAFLFDLQTDEAGNFYFARSGRKSPHKGGVIRISPDGKKSEMVCRDFRHPNGMGAGGPHGWITVSDNPSGNSVYDGIALVREGEFHGYEAPRSTPMLAVLPPQVDSSSGGQCWSDPKRWGPLGGTMIHTSYSHCAAFYVLTEDVSPHPNGFGVRFPFEFDSGVMRARVNPVDGQVYLVGQKGWDSKSPKDGCVYRIRHVEDAPQHLVTSARTTASGLRFGFSCDLDPKSVARENVEVLRVGKKESHPEEWQDVRLVDNRTIELVLPKIALEDVEKRTDVDEKTGRKAVHVNDPIGITLKLRAADGTPIEQTIYATINSVPKVD